MTEQRFSVMLLKNLVFWDVTFCGRQLVIYVPKNHSAFKKLVTTYLTTNISPQVNINEVDFLLLCFRAQGLRESAPADSVSIYHLKLLPILSHYFSHSHSTLFKFISTILNIKMQKQSHITFFTGQQPPNWIKFYFQFTLFLYVSLQFS